jgi:hypothetical protein
MARLCYLALYSTLIYSKLGAQENIVSLGKYNSKIIVVSLRMLLGKGYVLVPRKIL